MSSLVPAAPYDADMTTMFLDSAEVGDLLGLTAKTIRDYTYRGVFPPPDGHEHRRRGHPTPVWAPTTVEKWAAEHPRQRRVS